MANITYNKYCVAKTVNKSGVCQSIAYEIHTEIPNQNEFSWA